MNQISRRLIALALEEDLQQVGDLTSRHFVDEAHHSVSGVVAREAAVVSGQEVAQAVCEAISPQLTYHVLVPDGESIAEGVTIAEIAGPTRDILTAERTLLNFLQRLCGVATATRNFLQLVRHTDARVLDTRKTTPGMRELEKQAVVHGGGSNHRFGLYDAVMVKDNHLAANLSPLDFSKSIAVFRRSFPEIKLEVEADRLDQVAEFLLLPGVDALLLDNMSCAELREAVRMRDEANPRMILEASGGVTARNVAAIAETGVDFISIGALTHSVRSIDLGLDPILSRDDPR